MLKTLDKNVSAGDGQKYTGSEPALFWCDPLESMTFFQMSSYSLCVVDYLWNDIWEITLVQVLEMLCQGLQKQGDILGLV